MNDIRTLGVAALIGVGALCCANAADAAAGSGMPAAPASATKAAASAATPRTADGHPDLSGDWESRSGANFVANIDVARAGNGSVDVIRGGPRYAGNAPAAAPTSAPARAGGMGTTRNVPPYKDPALLAKADALFADGHRQDLVVGCGQPGLLRIGAPQKIVQTPKEIYFLYADISGQVWRIVRMDSKHRDTDPSFYGDSVGHWEGDTLVVHTNSLIEDIWMGEYGYTHSDKLAVTERLTRQGKTMNYAVTVEDPGVLTRPWVKAPVTMTASSIPLEEPVKCVVIEDDGKVGHHEQRIP